ncbi:hypothetical protein [Pseudomonas sp. DSP3-2-2]|uniref:hypothetical protein n=1 Tax=unclassified Pseudomonas TaxID=196821 RepID=UPI003CF236FE
MEFIDSTQPKPITDKKAKKTPETLRFQAPLPVHLWCRSGLCARFTHLAHGLLAARSSLTDGAVHSTAYAVDLISDKQNVCQLVLSNNQPGSMTPLAGAGLKSSGTISSVITSVIRTAADASRRDWLASAWCISNMRGYI